MAMALSELRGPEPDPDLELVEREDYSALARLNEIAYGYPAGDLLETTTLQSTKLGYRDYGIVQMWERRKDG